MDNAGGVRGRRRVGHLRRNLQRLRHRQPPHRDQFVQGLAGDMFHHRVLRFAFRQDVVDGDDVGVVQSGSGLRLLNESTPSRIARPSGRQNFHRDNPVQPRVARFIDFTHAALAQLFQEHAVGNGLGDKGFHEFA